MQEGSKTVCEVQLIAVLEQFAKQEHEVGSKIVCEVRLLGGFAQFAKQEHELCFQITHVMTAKVHWNVMKTDSGMVPADAMGSMFLNFEMSSRVWVAVPQSQNFSEPPINALFFSHGRPRQPSPKASEYPNMSQQMEMSEVIATLCRAVDSTLLKPERPAARTRCESAHTRQPAR
jgi:hypothetical protein